MTSKLTESDLAQFSGSETFFAHPFGGLVYTEGVKYLADRAGAYWLIDAIASYQRDRRIIGDRMLRDLQFWELTVKDGAGVLACVADSDLPPAITQAIGFTDFPLAGVRVWVERGSVDGVTECMVAMLPSER
jgi:hypothetical protein